nr:immunoglobulin light chain junction region [Macaca mulatta]
CQQHCKWPQLTF